MNTDPLTEAEIARVIELDAKATKGLVFEPHLEDEGGFWSVIAEDPVYRSHWFPICEFQQKNGKADAELFAEYRTLCPRLAREVERLTQERDDTNELISKIVTAHQAGTTDLSPLMNRLKPCAIPMALTLISKELADSKLTFQDCYRDIASKAATIFELRETVDSLRATLAQVTQERDEARAEAETVKTNAVRILIRGCNHSGGFSDLLEQGMGDCPICFRAQLAASEADRWKPIETAPKDGTLVIVTNDEAKGSWVASYKPVYLSGFRPPNPWQSMMLNHKYLPNQRASTIPTHWQPLPQPPHRKLFPSNH